MAASQPAAKRQKIADANDTASTSAPCPTSKIFTVVEVLENILSNLSLTELTRAERVNSLWKDLIRTAPGLQEQRFLKAAPITTLLTWAAEKDPEKRLSLVENWDEQPRLNYNVSTASLGSFDDAEHKVSSPSTDKIVSSLHPCLTPDHFNKSDNCNPYVVEFLINAKAILSWAPGPWEAMQVTQPPCDKMDLRLSESDLRSGQNSFFESDFFKRYEDEKGVATLGDLRDLMTEILTRYNDGKSLKRCHEFLFGVWSHQEERSYWVQVAKKFEADYPPAVEAPSAHSETDGGEAQDDST